ncbi:Cytochrome c554 and c-prime [Desulfopila aestuarii DSM 18488]|uniref:Cytochrome c554 and c-prime n=1 Tax=Desulfopila aestuarii DSM 18488 TaxID=1121416 RepID=A0A1M7Y1N4_9BACT|nr:Cytochrome c554 and c-prime [Desulfopila aestuarii DSM 18488]
MLLDSGNILFKAADKAQILDQDVLTAKTIVEVYTTLHYDAMAIGPYDLTAGLELVTRTFASGTPWISANLLTPSGKPIFSPWVVKNIGETRVGIVGLTGNITPATDYVTVSWQESLPQYIDELSTACDFIILLSTLEKSENDAIAELFPQIQLIISSDPKAGNVAPLIKHNSLFTQTHTRGKYLGILNVSWSKSVVWQAVLTDSPTIIADLEKRYQQQLQTVEADNKDNTTKVDRLQNNLRVLKELQANPQNVQPDTYTFRFRSLADHIKKNPAIDQQLELLKQEIASTNRKARMAKPPEVSSGPVDSTSSSQGGFTGSGQCGECHNKQYAKWLDSAHARAIESLTREQQQYNVRCLSCHVTWDMNGNIGSEMRSNLLTLPQELTNVGCESCHGAGKMHVDSKGEAKTFKEVTKATCTICHTPEMDAQFNFQTRLSQLGCVLD